MRVVVAVAVELAIVAVVAQHAVDAASAVGALTLAPVGYWFSYRRRYRANLFIKVCLAVGLLAAMGQFLDRVQAVTTVDEAQHPARVVVPVGADAARLRRPTTARPRLLDDLEPDPDGGGRGALAHDGVPRLPDPVGGSRGGLAVPVELACGATGSPRRDVRAAHRPGDGAAAAGSRRRARPRRRRSRRWWRASRCSSRCPGCPVRSSRRRRSPSPHAPGRRRRLRWGRVEPEPGARRPQRSRELRARRLSRAVGRRRPARAGTPVEPDRVPRACVAAGALARGGVRHVRRGDLDDRLDPHAGARPPGTRPGRSTFHRGLARSGRRPVCRPSR